jgi:hypothetical protein
VRAATSHPPQFVKIRVIRENSCFIRLRRMRERIKHNPYIRFLYQITSHEKTVVAPGLPIAFPYHIFPILTGFILDQG